MPVCSKARRVLCLALGQGIPYKGYMMNRICAWIVVGGLAIFWLPLGAGASNCQMAEPTSEPRTVFTLHLSAGCTEQEREAQVVDATQLLQAFKEGKGIDLSGVIILGDLILDTLPVSPLPPELEGMKELQGLKSVWFPAP